jgi:EmrB/QacA subfamily drug resistance transporter
MSNITSVPCDEGAIRGKVPPPASTRAGVWVLTATILGSSMVFIDGTVVNVTLPALQRALNATGSEVQWVVEAYALFLSALLLVGGSLGDMYGRRRVFVIGTLLFAGASAWCGVAPNIQNLIMARGLQGIGGALLVPGSLALISSSFCAEERGRAIGTWSGFTAITAAIGPVLGGWLIQHGSWRWVFFINLPLAIVVIAISEWKVPDSRREDGLQRLDWVGAGLITAGLGGVTFSLIEAARGGVAVVAAGVGGVAALIAFVLVEQRVDEPMLPFLLFRSRSFCGANLLTLFLYAAFGGVLFFLPRDLIEVQGYSPTQAGGALLPLIVLIFLLSRWSGGLAVRCGAKVPLMVGPTIAAVGFGLFTRGGVGGTYSATILPAVLVLGLGMAVSVAPLTTTVMSSIEQSRAGVASGINNAVSRVGGLLAVAVLGLVFSMVFGQRLDRGLDALTLPAAERVRVDRQRAKLGAIATNDLQVRRVIAQSFVDAYGVVLWIAVGLSLASAVSAAVLITAVPRPEKGSAG